MKDFVLLENSNGTFQFVGKVPCKLGFVTKAGNIVNDKEVQSQLRLPANYRSIKTRVFNSANEAWKEAERLGYVRNKNK